MDQHTIQKTLDKFYQDYDYLNALSFLNGHLHDSKKWHPNLQSFYYGHKAKCHSRLGEYKEADDCFAKSMKASPSNLPSRLDKIESLIQRGEVEVAKQKLDKYDDSPNPYFVSLLCNALKISGHYQESIKNHYLLLNQSKNKEPILEEIVYLDKTLGEAVPSPTAGVTRYITSLSLRKIKDAQGLGLNLAKEFLLTRLNKDTNTDNQSAYHLLLTKIYMTENDIPNSRHHFNQSAINNSESNAIIRFLEREDVMGAKNLFERLPSAITNKSDISHFIMRDFTSVANILPIETEKTIPKGNAICALLMPIVHNPS